LEEKKNVLHNNYFLLYRYGNLQKNAEEKMFNIIRTCVWYQDYPRVNMFLRLLSIIDDQPYEFDGSDLDFYLFCLTGMDEDNKQNPGYSLAMNISSKNLINLRTGVNFITNLVKSDESMNAVLNLDTYLDQVKEKKESEYGNPSSVIDCDYVISVAVNMRYNYFQIQYKKMFDVMDLEQNDSINIERFILLYRNINKSSYTFRKAYQLWKTNYDLIDEERGQEYLTFRYFALIAEKNKLFGHHELTTFMKASLDKKITDFNQLEQEWTIKKLFIKLKLLKANRYTVFMQKLLDFVEDYLYSPKSSKEGDEIAWIRYRILEEEANNGYMENLVRTFIPDNFSSILSVSEFYI
jgi:hypothetical protein